MIDDILVLVVMLIFDLLGIVLGVLLWSWSFVLVLELDISLVFGVLIVVGSLCTCFLIGGFKISVVGVCFAIFWWLRFVWYVLYLICIGLPRFG